MLSVLCVTENFSKCINRIKTFYVFNLPNSSPNVSIMYMYLYNEQLLLMLRAYYHNSCHQKTKLHTNTKTNN